MHRQRLLQSVSLVVAFMLLMAFSGAEGANASVDDVRSAGGKIEINEVMFQPGTGQYEWVELTNAGTGAINISGYQITDQDDNWYTMPDTLPDVPAGAFVVVVFDGQGSSLDDVDFSDNFATLHTHTGLTDIFEDEADQVALYRRVSSANRSIHLPLVMKDFISWNPPVPGPPSDFQPSSLAAFVAWGAAPGDAAEEASAAGIWQQAWYVNLFRGLGEESDETAIRDNESIGLLPDAEPGSPDDWQLFKIGEVTRGQANSLPVISWYYPDAGATLDGATFAVSWAPVHGATGYRFQMDNSSDFSSPVTNVTVVEPSFIPDSPVPEGAYYWRVQVQYDGDQGPWSSAYQINSLTLPSPLTRDNSETTIVSFKTLGIAWQQQHKDTNMLCLDGDAETGTESWSAPHGVRGTHGRNYCVRASVAMLASYYGGSLSQDRITYETFKGGGPEGDLGHDVPFSGTQARASFTWAVGANVPADFGKPTFAQIKAWIDADRPMRSVVPGHSRAIDGYFEFVSGTTTWQFLHVLDPWDRAKWVNYADDDIKYVQVGPAGTDGAPNVRSDEDVDGDNIADTMDDSDADGVSDFDERNRFNLDHNDSDTDDDLVPDRADIREYVFNAAGLFNRRNADVDGDGLRKERDPDNDYAANNGTSDGCEDSDHDGKFESTLGETNNFTPADDKALHIQLTWPQLGTDVDLHLIKPGSAMWTSGDTYFRNRNPDWGPTGPCGNPTLDIDCITSCTVENIRLDKLENGLYAITLHYYSDRGRGPSTPKVTIWVQGVRHDFGPRQMTDDQVWTVATVEWPSRVVTPSNVVTAQSLADHPSKAE